MMTSFPHRIAAVLIAALAGAACASGTGGANSGAIEMAPGTGVLPIRTADADTEYEVHRLPHTEADVHFMTGMIAHHAQAVLIAGWAASHDASETLRRLCERIVVGQRDEIALMQRWLRNVGEPVPDGEAMYANSAMHAMHGMGQQELMPGMLTAEELARLDGSNGPEFDRLFLTYMIRHHEGAIVMVADLFGSPGAAQNEVVFRFASDVYADQTTEIAFMQDMLAEMTSDGATRDGSSPSPRS